MVPNEALMRKPEATDRQLEHLALDWAGTGVETFVIGSSDGDFSVTAKSLLKLGKQVWVIWERLRYDVEKGYKELEEKCSETFHWVKLGDFLSDY